MKNATPVVLLAVSTIAVAPLSAQETRSLDLTVNDVGISIGDSRRVIGLRLNFRDRRLEEVIGVNATIWSPYEYTGVVRGAAIGLPLTGARRIDGAAIGIFGAGASESIRGLAVGGLGIGAGTEVRGIAVGGLGVGSGGELKGIMIGGLGAGAGRSVRGLAVGGLGVGSGGEVDGIIIGGLGTGAGGDVRGLAVGGLGVGAAGNAVGILVGGLGAGVGGDVRGLSIGGLGAGVGGRLHGLTIAGVGVGAGGDVTGVQIAGVGIGSGGTLRWVSIAGIGVGAPAIEGLAVAAVVGGRDVHGLVIAPAYFKLERGGVVNGVNVSAFNHVRGTQQGLAIGIFNYARELDGLQVGVLNYAANKPRATRLLPVFNYARRRGT